ncbi:hypothetical protein Dda_7888 [Drechslerella dactyloides]|uniref:Uncharacterized protein n=1 Tax=Drechslerella dactyloides TaxID=74499 RepID=A0AAD6NG12_DREDA|nr:hypothetical protein Dda_7888 [Drechslerella dactyloides]
MFISAVTPSVIYPSEMTAATEARSRTASSATPEDDASGSPSSNAVSSTTPTDDYTFQDVDDEEVDIEIDDGLVTSAMKEEEAKYEAESEKIQKEEDEQLSNQLKKDGFNMKGLEFLLKKSTIYSSILSERLEQSRQEKANKAAKVEAKSSAEPKKPAPAPEETTTRATRSGAATVVDKPTEPESRGRGKKARKQSRAEEGSPASVGRASRTKSTKSPATAPAKGQSNLLTFFSKEKIEDKATVKEALEAAAEEDSTEAFGATATEQLHTRQPKLVTGCVMKDYQLEGLEWMASLFENGLNGILADEMGLGKTLQTISLFAFLRERGVNGPFLVAAPLSTLANWVDEFAKFTPNIPVVLYHGHPQERENLRNTRLKTKDYRNVGAKFPIVCTSYEIIMNDRKYLAAWDWKYIVVAGPRVGDVFFREQATAHWNSIAEQSQFDFSDLQNSGKSSEEIKKAVGANLVSSLHQILKPFLLRRLKSDVELSLPKKREYVLYAPLTQTQKELYRRILDRSTESFLVEKLLGHSRLHKTSPKSTPKKRVENHKRKATAVEELEDQMTTLSVPQQPLRNSRSNKKLRVDYKEKSDREYFKELENTPDQSKQTTPELSADEVAYQAALKEIKSKKMQNPIMQLRLACDSPHLFYWPWGDKDPDETLVTESGKMMLLDRLVPELFRRGHKVLIFSQFKVQLDILEEWATTLRNWKCCRIDGSVRQEDRRDLIKSFNSDPQYKLFLLSTRAGGLGINLTSADTVILYDSDWNPQQDLQAQDRAHRIGQTRPVIIYRLATAATVEQTLLEKADAKRRLEKLVIQKGKFKSMTASTTKTQEQEFADIKDILMNEDFEKFDVAESGSRILSDEDLDVLLDRSDEAYEKAAKGETKVSDIFKAVETKKTSEQDLLAQIISRARRPKLRLEATFKLEVFMRDERLVQLLPLHAVLKLEARSQLIQLLEALTLKVVRPLLHHVLCDENVHRQLAHPPRPGDDRVAVLWVDVVDDELAERADDVLDVCFVGAPGVEC